MSTTTTKKERERERKGGKPNHDQELTLALVFLKKFPKKKIKKKVIFRRHKNKFAGKKTEVVLVHINRSYLTDQSLRRFTGGWAY